MEHGLRRERTSRRRVAERVILLLVAALTVVTAAPEVLAWPYRAEIRGTTVYSSRPIPPAIGEVMARADALVAASPLAGPMPARRLFLSDGGWRWTVAALTTRGAFALRRPFRNAIVFNDSDVAADRIRTHRAVGGERRLSGVIAHETAHAMLAARYGEWRAFRLPAWLREGLADHVAQESSLTDADAQALRARGETHPALAYHAARRRVAAMLAANGGDVDALVAGH